MAVPVVSWLWTVRFCRFQFCSFWLRSFRFSSLQIRVIDVWDFEHRNFEQRHFHLRNFAFRGLDLPRDRLYGFQPGGRSGTVLRKRLLLVARDIFLGGSFLRLRSALGN